MIEVSHVTKRYGRLEAVRDVSFTIGAGEVVGLLGPNGAGKTTLMRVLTCYHLPSEGVARINSLDVREDSLAVRRLIGYLPENAPLYDDLTVAEYLEFIASSRGVRRGSRRDSIEVACRQCRILDVVGRPIATLSKGYRQRVGIAQALLHSPEILILDEPTAGLDPNQIVEIRELLKEIGRAKTVVLSTHILQEVEAVCSRVLILNKGEIVAEGTAEEIRRKMKTGARFRIVVRARGLSEEALSRIPRVQSVARFAGAGEETFSADLITDGAEGFGEIVFDWAVARGYKLLSSTPAGLSLEEIFQRLTSEGDARP